MNGTPIQTFLLQCSQLTFFRVGDLELEDGAPKKVFLKETIEKEVRLSYLERIQRTLPEEYFSVFPEKPNIEEWKPISGLSSRKMKS